MMKTRPNPFHRIHISHAFFLILSVFILFACSQSAYAKEAIYSSSYNTSQYCNGSLVHIIYTIYDDGEMIISEDHVGSSSDSYAMDDFQIPDNYADTVTSIKIIGQISRVRSYGTWGNCQFQNLEKLTISTSYVEEIGSQAYAGCKKLNQVILNEGLKVIGVKAFENTTSLTEITLPQSLLQISEQAFDGSGLEEILIPAKVQRLCGYGREWNQSEDSVMVYMATPFQAEHLKRIDVSENNPYFYGEEGVLYYRRNQDGSTDCLELLDYPPQKSATSYRISERTTKVSYEAFSSQNLYLKNLYVPTNVSDGLDWSLIADGYYASDVNLPNLESVNIDTGNRTYASFDGVLYEKRGLGDYKLLYYPRGKKDASFTLIENVSYVGTSATCHNPYLKEVFFPKQEDHSCIFLDYCFAGNQNMTTFSMYNPVLVRGKGIFAGCDALKSLYIPKGSSFDTANGVDPIKNGFYGYQGNEKIKELSQGRYATTNALLGIAVWSDLPLHSNDYNIYRYSDRTLYCEEGSQIENYAKENQISYRKGECNVTFLSESDQEGIYQEITVEELPVIGTYGTLPGRPKRDGYEFLGWYSKKSDGVRVTADSDLLYQYDHNLYAQWEKKEEEEIKLSTLSYSFSNSFAGFGYEPGFHISNNTVQKMFGINLKAEAVYSHVKAGWSGNCYGISATTAMFNTPDNGIRIADFKSSALRVYDLSNNDVTSNSSYLTKVSGINESNITLRNFIEMMQISQYQELIGKTEEENMGKLDTIAAIVKNIKSSKKPAIICMFKGPEGHAVVGYAVDEISDSIDHLRIYDSNYIEKDRYITLYKDKVTKEYTGWYYSLDGSRETLDSNYYNWGSDYEGCLVTYISYEDYLQTWTERGKTISVSNQTSANLLSVSSTYIQIKDASGKVIAKLVDGELMTDSEEIYLVREVGVRLDDKNHKVEPMIYIPEGNYTVENTSSAAGSFTASIAGETHGVAASIASGTISFSFGGFKDVGVSVETGSGQAFELTIVDEKNQTIVAKGSSDGKPSTLKSGNGVISTENLENAQISVNGVVKKQDNTSSNTSSKPPVINPKKYIPPATSITYIKGGKKSMAIKWKVIKSNASGYEVNYSLDKKFKKKSQKIINSFKTGKLTIKKLKKGKKYYVRIRTFRKAGNKKYTSAWSKVKAVKIK